MRRRLRKLEGDRHQERSDEREHQEKELTAIWEEAQRLNESFFREIARELRGELIDRYGLEGVKELDLSDETLLAEVEATPPFTIAEDGCVYCSHDGKPVTDRHQTLAEVWYWEFVEGRQNPRKLIHDEERQAFYMPEYPYELAFSRERCYLNRYFWALGDERANPRGNSSAERLSPARAEELSE